METIKTLTGLREKVQLQYGTVQLGAEQGMLKIVRKYEDSSIYLYINLTGKDILQNLDKEGQNVLCFNRLEENVLKDGGFVIFESNVQ